jgi:hypothetical protein
MNVPGNPISQDGHQILPEGHEYRNSNLDEQRLSRFSTNGHFSVTVDENKPLLEDSEGYLDLDESYSGHMNPDQLEKWVSFIARRHPTRVICHLINVCDISH